MGRQVGDGRRPACRRSLMPLWLERAGPQKCAVTIFEPPLCGGRRAGVREGRLGCRPSPVDRLRSTVGSRNPGLNICCFPCIDCI